MGKAVREDPSDTTLLMASLDRLGVGYYRSSADGRILAVNGAGARIYGYSPEEMVAGVTTFDTHVSPEERLRLTAALDRDGTATCLAIPGRHKSGRIIFVSASIHTLKGPGGEASGYEGVFTDSTAQVELERQHLEALSDLRRANAQMARLADFQESFLSALSHDLQTPPVVIQGVSELLLRGHYGPLGESQEKAVRTVHRNILQLSQMIEQLLQFSRLINGRDGSAPAPLLLQESIDRALSECRREWQEIHIRGCVEVPPQAVRVDADGATLDFLVKNLLLNCGSFVQPGFEVLGKLVEADGLATVSLTVKPLRPNLPSPHRILQRFFIVPGKPEEGARTSMPIGLAAGAYLAKLLGGELTAEPWQDEGLAVTLALPLSGTNPAPQGPESGMERPGERARPPRNTAQRTRSRSRK